MSKNCITDVEGILVGQITDSESLTGCTVILCEDGAVCSKIICGGGPGTRETSLLEPERANEMVHGIFLTGGSSYGLGVGDGVMKYLEEKGCGFDTTFSLVPIVSGAVIFDFAIGNPKVRPDREMGYQACLAASNKKIQQGNFGAGTGATISKALGFANIMKGGIGSASRISSTGIIASALTVVNAFGDIKNPNTGELLAGPLLNNVPQRTVGIMEQQLDVSYKFSMENTTLAVVATNVRLTKAECKTLAGMASYGLASTISPFGTSLDGDCVFVMSKGNQTCDLNTLGAMIYTAVSEAVMNAVMNAEDAAGVRSYKTIKKISTNRTEL